jgi:hypothetical protein
VLDDCRLKGNTNTVVIQQDLRQPIAFDRPRLIQVGEYHRDLAAGNNLHFISEECRKPRRLRARGITHKDDCLLSIRHALRETPPNGFVQTCIPRGIDIMRIVEVEVYVLIVPPRFHESIAVDVLAGECDVSLVLQPQILVM